MIARTICQKFASVATSAVCVAWMLFGISNLVAQVEVTYGHEPSSWDLKTMEKFKAALERSQWNEALAMCSERVQQAATNYPSAAVFLQTVVPIQTLLETRTFGRHLYRQFRDPKFPAWIAGANFVELPHAEGQPTVRWNWERDRIGQTDVIDFEPEPLAPWLAREITRKKEQAAASQKHHAMLEVKTGRIRSRLSLVGNQQHFVGIPIAFRLELINEGDFDLVYDGVLVPWNDSLNITSEDGRQVSHEGGTSYSRSDFKPIEAGQTVVLFDNLDIRQPYPALREPGRYKIQFSGRGLDVGVEIVPRKPGSLVDSNVVCTTNTLPSNVLEIEVKPVPSR